jgi:hypothetical protein
VSRNGFEDNASANACAMQKETQRDSMRTSWIRASLLLVSFVLLTTFVVAQGSETNLAPLDTSSGCERCVSKVFQFPNSSGATELQDVINMFRTVVEIRFVQSDVSQHTVSVTGSPEQIAISAKLVGASLLVHEPENPQPRDSASQPDADRELATSFIKALYLGKASMQQMQTLTNTLRSTAHIVRMQQLPSCQVIVVRGTSEQVTQADSLMKQ